MYNRVIFETCFYDISMIYGYPSLKGRGGGLAIFSHFLMFWRFCVANLVYFRVKKKIFEKSPIFRVILHLFWTLVEADIQAISKLREIQLQYGPFQSIFLLPSTSIDFNQLGNLSWRVNSRIYVTFATYLAQNDALRGYVVMLIVLSRTLLWSEEFALCSGE